MSDAFDGETASAGAAGSSKQQSAHHKAGEACDANQAAARSCTSGSPSRQPLQCTDEIWREQPPCNEGQRCETAPGPDQGKCVKIAHECIGRVPDEPFCDDRGVRVCSNGISNTVRLCNEQQHCLEKDSSAECECTGGTVEVAGQCQLARSCDDQHGGCDPLADCTMNGSSRMCGACRKGYSGDGMVGCTPLLIALTAADATLRPALSDDVRSYDIHLPFFQSQLSLAPLAADGVEINVNGTKLAPGASWTSDKLSIGQHPLAITLTAPNGLTSRYEILVEHTGGQEAFIKAAHPDRADTFGYILALSGDTLVVGAVHEDGADAVVNGDETSNALADSGAAYVFVREGSTWRQEAYLKSDEPREGGHFGGGVAIDGDLVLVGELRDDPFPLVDHPENYDKFPGIVHVFMRAAGKWSSVAKIQSPSSAADLFGYSLALTNDQILIGAPYDDAAGRNSGAFYSMARDGRWGPLTKHTPKDTKADDVFAWSLAVDGDNLMVGAPHKSNVASGIGKAVYFKRAGETWTEDQVVNAAQPQEGDCFGWSVALRGDNAAVGAVFTDAYSITRPPGHTFVFTRPGGSAGKWQLQKDLTASVPRNIDYFGSWVGFAGPNTLFVSAAGEASAGRGVGADPTQGVSLQSGAFYLFDRQGDDWLQTSFVKANPSGANAWLGQQAAISGDTIAVSAASESSAAVGINGDVSGSLDGSGAAYVFR